MDPRQHFVQAELRTALHRGLAKRNPLLQHLAHGLGHWATIQTHHRQVDGRRAFQAGVRQQRRDEFLLFDGAGFGFEHQTHWGVFARLIAHTVEHRQDGDLEHALLGAQGFLAGLHLGVGEFFNFFQHLLAADTGWQLVHHQLPLTPRQVFNHPACTHFERAPTGGIGVCNVRGAADDLTATGVIRAGQERQQFFVAELGVFDQRHTGIGHFAQVVAGDFGGHAHGDAAGAIEQRKRQTCGQLLGLFGGTVVVGLEVHRAFVNLVEQQTGDAGQTCLGVTHGCSAIAIARAKIALAIYQWVALRKILRHAHQGVVGGAVAVRVVTAQHIAHHTRTFHRPCAYGTVGSAKAQAHARHRIQNAPLHRLLAIAHIGQGAALDHAQGVFQVGTLGVVAQGDAVIRLGRGVQINNRCVTHGQTSISMASPCNSISSRRAAASPLPIN